MGSLQRCGAKVHELSELRGLGAVGWCVGSAEALVATQPVHKLLSAMLFAYLCSGNVLTNLVRI